uniref:Leucine-rich repeat-containing N-terminal plant-type domain-containing protein n=1 Tax=Chenopodium quinoa TaxID=63459 RepID=A0A803M2I9_CHEQI
MQQLTTIYTLDNTNYRGNVTDYMALLAIKSKLIDRSPNNNGVMRSWNHSLHHCYWEGVVCGPIHNNKVTELQLPAKGLGGSISPFIGNLSFLRLIRFSNNSLQGQIPPQIGRLFRLQSLYLNNNSLSGEFPANISSCINLQNLSVAINNLHGELPMGLGALSNLKYMGNFRWN